MGTYSHVVCRPQNCFSENEHFKHQLTEMLKLFCFRVKLSVSRPMLIGVSFNLSGMSLTKPENIILAVHELLRIVLCYLNVVQLVKLL
jgi:hypothetical protein